MDNIPENFFELTLSQQGATWLLRLYRIVRWLYALVIVFGVLLLLNIAIRSRFYLQYKPDTWLSIFQTRIYPVVEVIIVIFGLIQNFYYFNFSRICKKSIEVQQADLFNDSFKWLYKSVVVAIILTILQLIMVGVATYCELILTPTGA